MASTLSPQSTEKGSTPAPPPPKRGLRRLRLSDYPDIPNNIAAEHLPLCHLEFVHIALYGSGAPAFGQSRMDGIPVATQVAAEAAQFGRTSLVHIGDPLIQLATAAFTYQTQEM